jgi:adenine-specific DNA-methyltransferase
MRFIGNKLLLLKDIENFIDSNIYPRDNLTFCDIFSGSGSVARYFKKDYTIISNDILYFSYILQKATIYINKNPKFSNLDILNKNFITLDDNYLNNILFYLENTPLYNLQKEYKIKDDELFIYNNYTPSNSSRMYFTPEIGKRIDLIRIIIEKWYENDLINENEYVYLLALLIETVPFYSNISGVYAAYLKHWDRRSLKTFKFANLDIKNNNKNNKSYNYDAHELIKNIKGDILYLDPPYNHRQYPPNYHILETVAKYDYPKIKGVSGMRDYSEQISKFCKKKEVKYALENIVKNADFKYIIMSYSTDGILTSEEIEEIFRKYDNNETFKMAQPIKYRKYKSKQKQKKNELHELLFFVEKENNNTIEKSDVKINDSIIHDYNNFSKKVSIQTKLTDCNFNRKKKVI